MRLNEQCSLGGRNDQSFGGGATLPHVRSVATCSQSCGMSQCRTVWLAKAGGGFQDELGQGPSPWSGNSGGETFWVAAQRLGNNLQKW